MSTERKGNPDETPYAGYEQADDHGDSSTSSGGYGVNKFGDSYARGNQGVDPGSFADAKPKESQSSNPPTRIGSTASLMDLPQGMDYSELRVMTDDQKNRLPQQVRDALVEKQYAEDSKKGEHIGA